VITDQILLPGLWVLGSLVAVTVVLMLARRFGATAIVAIYCALYVISAVLANKLIVLFGLVVPAGTILFSVTFLLTDLLSEVYGKREAYRAVCLGLVAQVLLLCSIAIAIRWPSPVYWEGQEAFASALGNTWRIVIASLVAYILSQSHDVWAFHLLKRLTNDKHLWLRNNLSTLVSQTIDSVVFSAIAFLGLFPILPLILGLLGAKAIIAILDTPFIYVCRWYLKRPPAAGESAD